MSGEFSISFVYPLQNSREKIRIKAVAELHHSVPYYVVKQFEFEEGGETGAMSLFPAMEIQRIEVNGKSAWVHKDSQHVTLLSMTIGRAIEEAGALA